MAESDGLREVPKSAQHGEVKVKMTNARGSTSVNSICSRLEHALALTKPWTMTWQGMPIERQSHSRKVYIAPTSVCQDEGSKKKKGQDKLTVATTTPLFEYFNMFCLKNSVLKVDFEPTEETELVTENGENFSFRDLLRFSFTSTSRDLKFSMATKQHDVLQPFWFDKPHFFTEELSEQVKLIVTKLRPLKETEKDFELRALVNGQVVLEEPLSKVLGEPRDEGICSWPGNELAQKTVNRDPSKQGVAIQVVRKLSLSPCTWYKFNESTGNFNELDSSKSPAELSLEVGDEIFLHSLHLKPQQVSMDFYNWPGDVSGPLLIYNCSDVQVTNRSAIYTLSLPNPKKMKGWMLKQAIFDHDGILPTHQTLTITGTDTVVSDDVLLGNYFTGENEELHVVVQETPILKASVESGLSKITWFHFMFSDIFKVLMESSSSTSTMLQESSPPSPKNQSQTQTQAWEPGQVLQEQLIDSTSSYEVARKGAVQNSSGQYSKKDLRWMTKQELKSNGYGNVITEWKKKKHENAKRDAMDVDEATQVESSTADAQKSVESPHHQEGTADKVPPKRSRSNNSLNSANKNKKPKHEEVAIRKGDISRIEMPVPQGKDVRWLVLLQNGKQVLMRGYDLQLLEPKLFCDYVESQARGASSE